ncbi:hypothetical protein AJ79_09738 [Helicocarpus griseus UAMH5409]|uniref:Uncharacterized protein n=1 Tax=Helicocarpus griseus UAMH5409 TaxID=1447875 RepID=A0A2B7WHT4_9EURO|nr:hypothetical protein AJ79_09738 [Helicocarpus griseus UAMH5409]
MSFSSTKGGEGNVTTIVVAREDYKPLGALAARAKALRTPRSMQFGQCYFTQPNRTAFGT